MYQQMPGLGQFLFILGFISCLGLTIIGACVKCAGNLSIGWGWVVSPVPIFVLVVLAIRGLIALIG